MPDGCLPHNCALFLLTALIILLIPMRAVIFAEPIETDNGFVRGTVEEGNSNDTPILVGYNSDEGASFPNASTPEAYAKNTQERYDGFAEKLLKFYPPG